jgi:hypothetical protein
MYTEFINRTQRYQVKRCHDRTEKDEALIRFEDKNQIRSFFNSALNDPFYGKNITRIARDFTPRFIATKPQKKPSEETLLERLYTEIFAGRLNVVIKNSALKSAHESTTSVNNDEETREKYDLMQSARGVMERLRKVYSTISCDGFLAIDIVYNVKDDYPNGSVIVKFDPTSVQDHSTEWMDWDKPFEIKLFGGFKALVGFKAGSVLGLGGSSTLAFYSGYASENIKMQYKMTGKSMIGRQWNGSYCLRFNVRRWTREIAWVKYEDSGPDQRYMIELNRAERVVKDNLVLYEKAPMLVKPFTTVEKFLSELESTFQPPEHDINKPIPL